MSRSTQHIGLNKYAGEWVHDAIRTEGYSMCKGMFDEEVIGTIYHMPVPEGPNKALIAKEVVQDAPWSSGPMIFTHLQVTLVKENGQELDMGCYFSWMFDPRLLRYSGDGTEYDYETGRYGV